MHIETTYDTREEDTLSCIAVVDSRELGFIAAKGLNSRGVNVETIIRFDRAGARKIIEALSEWAYEGYAQDDVPGAADAKPGELPALFSGPPALDRLRSRAAAASTGTVKVTIEELNVVAAQIFDKPPKPTIPAPAGEDTDDPNPHLCGPKTVPMREDTP